MTPDPEERGVDLAPVSGGIKESVITSREERPDQNQPTQGGKMPREIGPVTGANGERFSPYIAAIITDFSGELGEPGAHGIERQPGDEALSRSRP